MSCDPHLSRPILNGLPQVFKVNVRTDSAGHWLETSIMHLVDEAVSGRVGSEAMLAKLLEALFVDTLRRYVDGLPKQHDGWLAGARDPIVGRSLALLHGRVAHPCTIADLADEVGISRSAGDTGAITSARINTRVRSDKCANFHALRRLADAMYIAVAVQDEATRLRTFGLVGDHECNKGMDLVVGGTADNLSDGRGSGSRPDWR